MGRQRRSGLGTALEADVPSGFAERVVAWQRRHGRHGLPWQGTRDAYRIWLSEVMLQQTQVRTVIGYYAEFLRRFPTVVELAAAHEDEVMSAWSGLGYYSRARNLHRCAQAVVTLHGGVFPTQAAVLETLPGIGRSTAAAIAAFSCGERVAILDGNVKRVLGRVLAFGDDLARPAAVERLWAMAQALLPEQGVETYTQGLMDLGATLCLARRPACERCPVQGDCRAAAQGRPLEYPVKTRRLSRSEQTLALLLATRAVSAADGGAATAGSQFASASSPQAVRWWLVKRPSRGVWAGLWSFPTWPGENELLRELQGVFGGAGPAGLEPLAPVTHALTHRDLHLKPYRLHISDGHALALSTEEAQWPQQWWTLEEALGLGLPAPVRRWLEAERARLTGGL